MINLDKILPKRKFISKIKIKKIKESTGSSIELDRKTAESMIDKIIINQGGKNGSK